MPEPQVFRDRRHAGQVLARALAHHANRPDVIVLALPRGGAPVAFEVAQALHLPLDVVFNEDDARTRKNYGPQNLAVLRRIAFIGFVIATTRLVPLWRCNASTVSGEPPEAEITTATVSPDAGCGVPLDASSE